MMRVCCWHWVLSLQQCEQTWLSCTWHSAATVSRQDDGDDGTLVYLYVPGNICQSCCSGVCVSVCVRCREIQRCSLLSFYRFMLCLSFSYNQNAIDTVGTDLWVSVSDPLLCSTQGSFQLIKKKFIKSHRVVFLYLFNHVVFQEKKERKRNKHIWFKTAVSIKMIFS